MANFNPFLKAYSLAVDLSLSDKPWFKYLFRRAYFIYKRYKEDPYYLLLSKHPDLLGDGVILDVGANIGYTSWVFSEFAKEHQKIFAFEPDQSNFDQLVEVLADRRLMSRVRAVRTAVGNHSGEVTLVVNKEHHADHKVATEKMKLQGDSKDTKVVPILSLDGFLAEAGFIDTVSFVKIDVQGYEEVVCEGMVATLERNPNIVVALEYSPADFDSLGFNHSGIDDFFESRSFVPHVITKGSLQEVRYDALSKMARQKGYFDVVFLR